MSSRSIAKTENTLVELYESLKEIGNKDLLSAKVPQIIVKLDSASRFLLSKCKSIELKSLILGKEYFVFALGEKISRPINKNIFNIDLPSKHSTLYLKNSLSVLEKEDLMKLLYTLSMSFCAAIDILRVGNKKTPATFFEKFIGNLFSRELNVKPTNALEMLNDESLATDFIFKTEKKKADIHLQIKLSTRERAIEAWAHQRIIDGIFGVETYRGILVVMSETNIKRSNMSVVDVCVPNQWGLYQKYISKLYRVYYLDVPTRTENLHLVEPYIQVKHLSEFFFEKNRVLLRSVD
jgi:hypothetical protein